MTTETTTLRFREGSSDKQYAVTVEPSGDGFVVNAAWGRTGSTQQTACKTAKPVSLEQAHKVATKLLNEKRAKGYTDVEGGRPYEGTENAGRDTGIRVQLLNPVGDAELSALLHDPAWGMQEKYDANRGLIIIDGDRITGANRKGLETALAGEVVDVVRERIRVTGKTILDGENFGTTFAPFDLLMLNGSDLRDVPYQHRLVLLEQVIAEAVEMPRPHTYRSTEQKLRIFEQLKAGGFEGVVFKRMDAPYTAGRPNSGGDALKFKFTDSATCRVIDANVGKRSVGLELLDEATGLWRCVGNCTIPANLSVPAAGQCVEVGYLYAYPNGSLFQPVYKGVREELDAADCKLGQLKYKVEQAHSQAA